MMTAMQPLATGVPDLDLLLGGGLSRQALVVVIGPAGAGKTVLASQILFHAVQQETPSLILTAYSEDHTKLVEHLRPFTFFDERALGTSLTLLSLSSISGMDVATATAAIMRPMREAGARMVLLDGFQGIADQLSDVTARRRLLAAIAAQLTYLHITLLVTLTGTTRDDPATTGLTSADVVLGLHYLWWLPVSSVAVFLRLALTQPGGPCAADQSRGICADVRISEETNDADDAGSQLNTTCRSTGWRAGWLHPFVRRTLLCIPRTPPSSQRTG